MHLLCPDGDICEDDWVEHFGMTQTEYAEPIRIFHAQVPAKVGVQASRNDIVRQSFLDHTDNLKDQDKAASFYARDWYQRLLAYEMGNGTLEKLSQGGREMGGQDVFQEAMWVGVEDARKRFGASSTGEGLRIFEHGFGAARQVLGFMGRYPQAQYTLCDLHGAFRDFLAEMIKKYVRGIGDISFHWVDETNGLLDICPLDYYHYINSSEIMEHCPDPVATVGMLGRMLKPNGVLHMSTFFNDCDGNDVTHLLRNNKYQDFNLWLAEGVHPAGLRVYGKDPRGVEKLFEKVAL